MALIGFFLWHAFFYRAVSENVTATETGSLFTDSKFSYSIEFPKGWEIERYAVAAGAIEGFDPANESTRVLVWYKDSEQITDQDQLLAFVEEDRKYGEEEQKLKTITLGKADVGEYKVVKWRSLDPAGLYNDTYYFYDPAPDLQTQVLWVWIVSITAKTEEELSTPVARSTLKTFRILP